MSVQYTPTLGIAYDSTIPLDAQRAFNCEVQNQLRLKHEFALNKEKGNVVMRDDVLSCLTEIALSLIHI